MRSSAAEKDDRILRRERGERQRALRRPAANVFVSVGRDEELIRAADAKPHKFGGGIFRYGGNRGRSPAERGDERSVEQTEGRRIALRAKPRIHVVDANDLPAERDRARIAEAEQPSPDTRGQRNLLPHMATKPANRTNSNIAQRKRCLRAGRDQ